MQLRRLARHARWLLPSSTVPFVKKPSFCEPLESRRLLSTSLSLNGAQFPTPTAAINVSSDTANGQSEMLIAINPTNPLNVVGFSHRLPPGGVITLDLYRSTDGGNTWTTTQIDNSDDGRGTTGNRYDPALAFDANGILYIAYGYRGTSPDQLIAATSSDGGANFGNFRVLDSQNGFTSTSGNNLPGVDRWSITTGRDGASTTESAVITYTQNGQEGASSSTDQRIVVVGTRDGGANWTAPLIINDGSISGADAGNLAASPTIGLGGELSVAWYDGGTSIMFDTDRNGLWGAGFTFGTDRTVRNATGLVNITPPAQPERGIAVSPVLGSNIFNGDIYITFQERFGASTGNDTDIYFGRSTDSGVSWTWQTVENGTGTDFHPMMSVDRQSNAIGIAYYTTDGDQTTGNDDVRLRLALSGDLGNTWYKSNIGGAQTSNEAGGYGGDYLEYIGLALRDGTAHMLWASRYAGAGGVVGTDLDAFTSRASFDSSTNNNILRIGGSGSVNNTFVVRRSTTNSNYVEVFTDGARAYTGLAASIDSITFESNGGIDSYSFDNLPSIPINILGSTGADTFNIDSLSGASLLTISAGNGDDVLRLGGATINAGAIASPVTFNGGDGNDTLYLGSPGSGNADSVVASVTFNGEGTPGGLGNRIFYNDQEAQYQVSYNIGPSAVTRAGFFGPRTLTYSNTSRIVVNAGSDGDLITVGSGVSPIIEAYGNNGDDIFTVGGGLMDAGAGPIVGSFNGGGGTNQITFDDHLRSSGVIWDIYPSQVIYGGIFVLNTTAFQAVGILAGNGADQIYFYNAIDKPITVDGGGGADTFYTNGSRANSLTLTGGAQND